MRLSGFPGLRRGRLCLRRNDEGRGAGASSGYRLAPVRRGQGEALRQAQGERGLPRGLLAPDADAGDAAAGGAEDLDAEAAGDDLVALAGDLAELVEDQPAHGVKAVARQVNREVLLQEAQVDAGVQHHLVRADDLDLLLLLVELVHDVADDLLQDVLQGDEARGAAVLVHHDGHVAPAALELQQQLVDALALGDEEGGAQVVAQDGPLAAST